MIELKVVDEREIEVYVDNILLTVLAAYDSRYIDSGGNYMDYDFEFTYKNTSRNLAESFYADENFITIVEKIKKYVETRTETTDEEKEQQEKFLILCDKWLASIVTDLRIHDVVVDEQRTLFKKYRDTIINYTIKRKNEDNQDYLRISLYYDEFDKYEMPLHIKANVEDYPFEQNISKEDLNKIHQEYYDFIEKLKDTDMYFAPTTVATTIEKEYLKII